MQPQKLSAAELVNLAQLDSPLVNLLGAWLNKQLACVHCKKCTLRCEVLELPELDIGAVEADFKRIVELAVEERSAATLRLVQKHPDLYQALRRCCFCGYCTAACATHMTAPARMREWRELFTAAGLMPVDDSRLVMVDNEWHIFSAYRAIYGVAYPEFFQLEQAAAGEVSVDTLFFPGCSLTSYAPELMQRVGQWLNADGCRWAMSSACCGSPLMSAGLFERSHALRSELLRHIRTAGITRVLTVCPGCGEELAEVMGDEVDIVPLPELLLERLDQGAELPAQNNAQNSRHALTFFDSCHDRFDTRHGTAVRSLLARCLPESLQVEIEHRGKNTLCCGAGGAVAAYDPDITQRRVWRIIDEARATGANTLVTTCPTCTYTIGQALLGVESRRGIASHNYLELIFDQTIDWPVVFSQLETMWSGEYGPWLSETFFSS